MIQKRKHEGNRGLSYETKRGLTFTVDVYRDMELIGYGAHLIRNGAYQKIIFAMYLPFIGQTAFFIESNSRQKPVTKQVSIVLHGNALVLTINNNNYVLKKGKD